MVARAGLPAPASELACEPPPPPLCLSCLLCVGGVGPPQAVIYTLVHVNTFWFWFWFWCGRVLVVVTAPEVHVNTFWFWFWFW